jgi:hypothetical protein
VSLLRFAVYISPSDAWILASHNTLVKNVAEMCSVVDPRCLFRIRIFPFRIPDPGVKKVPDPGAGSATLGAVIRFLQFAVL